MKSRAVCRGVSEWLLLGRSVVAEFSSAHFARRNVHRPGEEFTGWKSNPVKEKIASRKDDRDAHNTLRQGRLSLLRQARGGGENESEDPRVTPPDTWGTQIHVPDLRLGHPPAITGDEFPSLLLILIIESGLRLRLEPA